jgi:ceramide glucosyltransferase
LQAIIDIVAIFCSVALAVHLTSIGIVLFRARLLDRPPRSMPNPGVSLLRPVCGMENNIEETLASTFALAYPRYEALFCVASPADPVIPLVERLIAAHPAIPARLLVGDDRVCGNPKLNNLVKGWEAARYGWIIMADSNVLLPRDYIQSLFSRWTPGTGLVSSPPIGIRPKGFWGELECAFLNTYQARWQLAADQLGLGFAQGKNMLWRRDVLDAAGGISALGAEVAEDVAATKIVHNAGLKVRLVRSPFPQPLGFRSLIEVWRRQLRWARLRRVGLKAYFIPELFTGGFFPLSAAGLVAAAGGLSFGWVAVVGVVWFGAEGVLARSAGWPRSASSVLAWIVRDLLIPVLWVSAWAGNSFVWRGNPMATKRKAASDLGRHQPSTIQ